MTDTTVNSLKRDLINIDNIYIKFIQLEVYTTNFYKDPDLDLDLHYGLNLHNEFMMGNTDIFAAYGFYLRKSEYYTSRAYYKVGFKFYRKNVIGIVLVRAIQLLRADVVEFDICYRLKKTRLESKSEK